MVVFLDEKFVKQYSLLRKLSLSTPVERVVIKNEKEIRQNTKKLRSALITLHFWNRVLDFWRSLDD